jgi:hypothetical protein
MNRSQLRIRQAREALMRIGKIGAPVRTEARSAPDCGTPAGPRGPSGVIAKPVPSSTSLIICRSTRPAPREVEPRTESMPQRATRRAMISPSLCSLTIVVMRW